MKALKRIIIFVAVITSVIVVTIGAFQIYFVCRDHINERKYGKVFLSEYAFDDFSEFYDVDVWKRFERENDNPYILILSRRLIPDGGMYIASVDKNTGMIINVIQTGGNDSDTLALNHIAEAFMRYDIPRLSADSLERVNVYILSRFDCAFTRYDNDDVFKKDNQKNKLKKIIGNWYR